MDEIRTGKIIRLRKRPDYIYGEILDDESWGTVVFITNDEFKPNDKVQFEFEKPKGLSFSSFRRQKAVNVRKISNLAD